MTSKQALHRVCDNSINNTNWETGISRKQAVIKLTKDIEILEMIKQHPVEFSWVVQSKNYNDYGMIGGTIGFKFSETEFNLIKEWLKND